jgi:hypothetical protein
VKQPEQGKNQRNQIWCIFCAPNLIRIAISGLNQGKMRKLNIHIYSQPVGLRVLHGFFNTMNTVTKEMTKT